MAAETAEFSIFVKTLTGANSEVRVRGTDRVASLKSKIQAQLKLSVPIVRLVHNSKELGDDDKTLNDYEVGKEAIVVVVLQSSKPSHYFFALDESGSMSGRRWDELIRSFKDFVTTRHEDAAQKGEKLHDLVSVFFHQTRCRVADYIDAAGQRRPFDSVPLADVTPDSLANEFRSGGNNFDHVLAFLEPFLDKCTDYKPVLMFMTDGGDCGDDAPPCADFRQRAYDRMAAIKKRLPDLQLFVTVVYTTSRDDIEGGKNLCRAAAADIDTCFTYLQDDNQQTFSYPSLPLSYPSYPTSTPVPTSYGFAGAPPFTASYSLPPPIPVGYGPPPTPASYGPPMSYPTSAAPSPLPMSYPTPTTPPSAGSAQTKMTRQWEHVYQCTSSYMPS